MEADAKEKPLYQQKRNALKQAQTHSPFAMRGELEPPPDESSSATSSDAGLLLRNLNKLSYHYIYRVSSMVSPM